MTSPIVRREHMLEAIEIAKQGGNGEHPYDQSAWGAADCGSPCCVWGFARSLAGLPLTRTGPFDTGQHPVIRRHQYDVLDPYMQRVASLLSCPDKDVLRIIDMVQPDGSLDLSNCDLSGLMLRDINLSGVTARNTNFRGSRLEAAKFLKSDLTEADFTGADLEGANFTNAELTGTILPPADKLVEAIGWQADD